ncbi:MAG: hypothetical protein AB8H03_20635 [Saprospiraceae bacterium]
MKKQLILILFLLGNLTSGFSNNNTITNEKTDFDDLVGMYNGFSLMEEGLDDANKITAELTSDFHLKITENFDGLLVDHFNEKISPQAGGEMKDGGYLFEFKAVSSESEFSVIRIIIHDEVILSGTNLSMSISFMKHSEEKGIFAVSKEGGDPKKPSKSINFSDIHNSIFYTGKTQDDTFGDFKIEWYPSEGIGYLSYKNVVNVFKIEKKKHKYRLTNKYGIDLEYIYNDRGGKKMKLLDIHRGRKLLEKSVKYGNRISAKAIGDEKDFLIKIGASFYDAIHDRFKPKGNYTLTHDNKLNGKGIKILSNEEQFVIYAGGVKDGIFHGKGLTAQEGESGSGVFQNGIRHGQFEITLSNGGFAAGEFIKGIQEGLWKIKHANGATFDMVFENGKKINSTHTNSHLRVKNKRIQQLMDKANNENQILTKYKDLVEAKKRCVNLDKKENYLSDYKYCITGTKDEINGLTSAMSAQIQLLKKIMVEAKKDGCFETAETIEAVRHKLQIAKDRYSSASYYLKDLLAASSRKDIEKEVGKISKYMEDGSDFLDQYYGSRILIKSCFEYTGIGSSSSSSRSAAQKKSTVKTQTSKSTNQKSTRKIQPSNSTNQKSTSQKSTVATSSPVVYPVFTGKYEGDNLLLLMGRKIDDPAVQGLLKNSYFDFEESFNGVSKVQKKFTCNKYRFSIKFENGILTQMSFKYLSFDKTGYFKKRMPLGIPMAKPLSKMKNMKDNWKLFEYGSARDYSISKYQLSFEAKGDVNDGGVIQIVNISAEDVKDWNSYYQQFK